MAHRLPGNARLAALPPPLASRPLASRRQDGDERGTSRPYPEAGLYYVAYCRPAFQAPHDDGNNEMDLLMEILRAILMLGFVAVAILALAALFMVVFSLATAIDRRLNE